MDHVRLYRPSWRQEWRILRTQDTLYQTYYAFPSLIRVDGNVLITVKSGQNHVSHEPASLTQVILSAADQRILDTRVIYDEEGYIAQMGELVRMPDGDVCVYIDMQQYDPNRRCGMWELRSVDNGVSYTGCRRVGVIDGVEYGYPMQAAVQGDKVWMLAMTFSNLCGGRHREVHLIMSSDNGNSWRFCANLTERFGFAFNECTLSLCEEGFLIFTRGETDRRDRRNSLDDFDSGQYLVVMDEEYHVLRMRDYRHTTDFFSLTGRPRLYWLNGDLCLFTRQWNRGRSDRLMSLDMFRLDPGSLDILARVRLDEPRFPKQDGHYPVVYVQDQMLHVVTYLTCGRDERQEAAPRCDLVQLSYRLDEILRFGREEG